MGWLVRMAEPVAAGVWLVAKRAAAARARVGGGAAVGAGGGGAVGRAGGRAMVGTLPAMVSGWGVPMSRAQMRAGAARVRVYWAALKVMRVASRRRARSTVRVTRA